MKLTTGKSYAVGLELVKRASIPSDRTLETYQSILIDESRGGPTWVLDQALVDGLGQPSDASLTITLTFKRP